MTHGHEGRWGKAGRAGTQNQPMLYAERREEGREGDRKTSYEKQEKTILWQREQPGKGNRLPQDWTWCVREAKGWCRLPVLSLLWPSPALAQRLLPLCLLNLTMQWRVWPRFLSVLGCLNLLLAKLSLSLPRPGHWSADNTHLGLTEVICWTQGSVFPNHTTARCQDFLQMPHPEWLQWELWFSGLTFRLIRPSPPPPRAWKQ